MKFCPECNLEYEDESTFCTRDGSQLQPRAARVGVMKLGSRPASAGTLGTGALTATPNSAEAADTTRPVPSVATLQAQTVRAPPRAFTAPMRGASPPRGASVNYAKTIQSSSAAAARAYPEEGELTTQVVLPDHGPAVSLRRTSDVGADMLESSTVVMAASPVASPATPAPAAAPEPAPESEPEPLSDGEVDLSGRSIAGRYKLLKKLGEGGMGVVYAALDERIEKQVAVKVLREEFARRGDVVARFTQEARSAGRIKHENVLDVTDYGRADDVFYIAMELLVGTDLADVLQREKTLPPERGIDIAIQICRALAAAHREGVVHRDLKPENVFLVRSDDGREVAKIVDFGIAHLKDGAEGGRKLTRTGMIFGTPEYMSPEQAAGKTIDHRVDVYATGVILFEMFVGRVPFVGDTFMGVLTQHMFEPVPSMRAVNPECVANEDLEAVICKALAKDPAGRYASMAELADDLLRVRNGLRPSAPVGYDGTGTFLRSQMLAGAGIAPGAIAPSQPGAASVAAAGVARTIEQEIPPPRRTALYVGLGVGLLILGAVSALALVDREGPPPAPVRQPDPPAATPTPTPQPRPAALADASTARPALSPTVRVNVVTPGGVAEVRIHGEATTRCPATPCAITLPRGVLTTLVATSGARRATATVNTSADEQTVTMALPPEPAAPSRTDRRNRTRPPEAAPQQAHGPVDRHGASCRDANDCNCRRAESGLLIPCGF